MLQSKALRFVACLFVGFLSLSVAQAQGNDPGQGADPEARMERHHGPPTPAQELARMTEILNLSTAQQSAILPILEKRQQQMEALRASGISPKEGHEQMRSIMETTRAAVRAQLTEAQAAKLDTMRPPHRPGPENSGAEGEGGPPPPDPQSR